MPDIMDVFDTHEEVAKKVLSFLLWHGPKYWNGARHFGKCRQSCDCCLEELFAAWLDRDNVRVLTVGGCWLCRNGYDVKAVNERFHALVRAYAIDYTSGREHCACENQCQREWLIAGWICPVLWKRYSRQPLGYRLLR